MQNKLKVLFFAIMAMVVVSSCSSGNSKKESGQATFKANLNGGAGAQVMVWDMDPFNNNYDTLKVDGSGNFVISKDLKKPSYFNIVVPDSRTSFTIYLVPGDTLFMEAEMSNIFDTQKFSGNAAVENNYIASYIKSSNNFQRGLQVVFSKEEPIAVKAMDSIRDVKQKAFDELNKNSDLGVDFANMEQSRILYEWALLHSVYPMYYRYYRKVDKFQPSATYDNYLGACDLNNSSLLTLDMYKMFLSTYIGVLMEDYYGKEKLMKENPSEVLYRLQLIDKIFSDKDVKALLAYETVKGQVKQQGIKEYDLYIDTFNELCSNEKLRGEIEEMVSEWKHLKKGADAFEFTFVDMEGRKVSMSDFKGKYVYVDVWATWCSPCRAEIPHLKRIEEDFHGKNIVFISVSVDQTQDPWKEMVEKDNLGGIQLWAGIAPKFSEFYKITGIPRFMLFDKEGKIIESNAARPSGGIDKQIAELDGI